jgi:hypothetical protein
MDRLKQPDARMFGWSFRSGQKHHFLLSQAYCNPDKEFSRD